MTDAKLTSFISDAHAELLRNPDNALPPYYRREIYSTFDRVSGLGANRGRALLAQLAVRKVLPVWLRSFPKDDRPEELLHLAKLVLDGGVSVDVAYKRALAAWDALSEESAQSSKYEDGGAFFVLTAGVEALFETCGRFRFDRMNIDPLTKDADLDPWSSDTALLASLAFKYGASDFESESERSRQFWEWWLNEAVPEAWRLNSVQ